MMPKFRKKPVVIEAAQYLGPNFSEIENFVGGDCEFRKLQLVVASRTGPLWACPGDWFIREANGDLHSCKPDIFAETYEPVEGDQ